MTTPPTPSDALGDDSDDERPGCVMSFNASDPSGAGGIGADVCTMASMGLHCLPVVTGAYIKDSAETLGQVPFDDDCVVEQARAALEDIPARAFKVGFVGSPETLGAVAGIAADYAELPLVAYMPDLSWWDEVQAEAYLDAFRDLVLPQASVLVGNHTTLWRWLLPDWSTERPPNARELAKAAAEFGVPYTLVTGIALPDQHIDNVLSSPHTVLCNARFERFDAVFSGAGDTLSSALAAMIATGADLPQAAQEALGYLDRCLNAGFRPGMGHVIPDRMFWAQGTDEDDEDPGSDTENDLTFIDLPTHDTKH